MATAEPSAPPPSLPAFIAALGRGESASKTRRVAVTDPEAKDLNVVMSKLRNVVNQAVKKAKKEGSNFRVESGAILTDDKTAFLCTVAVTRLDGKKPKPQVEDDDNDDDVDI